MHFARLDAAEAMGELSGADVLIVDPPRKGLDKALLSALCAARAGGGAAASIEQLCYVSCGYDALERDARALLAAVKKKKKKKKKSPLIIIALIILIIIIGLASAQRACACARPGCQSHRDGRHLRQVSDARVTHG